MSFVQSIYGPYLIGIMVNLILYGILIIQTYIYEITFKKDKLWIKIYVSLLFTAITVKTVFEILFIYIRLVDNFGNLPALAIADWLLCSDPALTSIVVFLVQIFFARRVRLFTESVLLTLAIVLFSSIQLASGFTTAVLRGTVKQLDTFEKLKTFITLWLAFSAFTDAIIATALSFTLHKSRTGLKSTDAIINRLIRVTVQTGGLTALAAIIDLITYFASDSGLHLAFNLPLAHLYTNSLMSMLNFRTSSNTSDLRFDSRNDRNTLVLSRRLNGNIVDADAELGRVGGKSFSEQADPSRSDAIDRLGSISSIDKDILPFSGVRAPPTLKVHVIVDRTCSESASLHCEVSSGHETRAV